MKHFITDWLLRFRLLLDEFGIEIEYTQARKNIVADGLSRINIYGNQDTIQDNNYSKKHSL